MKKLEQAASVDIGRELLAVKARLPHGEFLAWQEAELGYSRRTSTNLMRVAEVFGDKWETVSHLPPSVLYQLASPSTPDDLRETVLSRVPAGQGVNPRSVKAAIAQAKQSEAKKESRVEREVRQTATMKREAAADLRQQEQRNRQDQAARQAVSFLREQLGPDLYRDFLAIVGEATGYSVGMKLGDEVTAKKARAAA